MSENEKRNLERQLDALKIFPDNELVRKLRKQVQENLEQINLESKIPTKKEKLGTNLSRTNKLKKYHRYIRLIRNNFPELSYSDIRKQFSRRKQGNEVSIPDVIWQNPSP